MANSWRDFSSKEEVDRYFSRGIGPEGEKKSKYGNQRVYYNKYTGQEIPKEEAKKILGEKIDKDKWILFDSKIELNYFKTLLMMERVGVVLKIELQPNFELQEGFCKGGKSYRAINYKADFMVYYKDRVEVIDTKGFTIYFDKGKRKVKGNITKEFELKRKLFEYKYPDLTLRIINGKGEEL